MTNLERLRQMSDEELSEFLIGRSDCPYMNDCKECGLYEKCLSNEKTWLNSEAEE